MYSVVSPSRKNSKAGYTVVCTQLSLVLLPVRNGSERLRKRLFLREERLSNAQGRGLCEANAGHAPRGMVSRGPGSGETPQAQALLPWLERYSRKKVPQIYIAIS
jgi:hypothetical protein